MTFHSSLPSRLIKRVLLQVMRKLDISYCLPRNDLSVSYGIELFSPTLGKLRLPEQAMLALRSLFVSFFFFYSTSRSFSLPNAVCTSLVEGMSLLRMGARPASPHSQPLSPSPHRSSRNWIAQLRRGGQGVRSLLPCKIAFDRLQDDVSLDKNPFLYCRHGKVPKPWSSSAEHVELSFTICRTTG
jgi:hypothetical protein